MNENQSESQSLDLTLFAKSIFEGNDEYDLLKNPNDKSHFEPSNNGFYGFCIPIPDFYLGLKESDIEDIDYEDVTHKKIA